MRLLFQHGADPNIADDNGMTPLHYAAQRGRSDLVRYMLAKGADIFAADHQVCEWLSTGGTCACTHSLRLVSTYVCVLCACVRVCVCGCMAHHRDGQRCCTLCPLGFVIPASC